MDEKRRATRPSNFTQPDGVALKEHLETRIAAQSEYFLARLDAVEKASCVAGRRLDERLAAMNEFRNAMGDLSNRMVTRGELGLQMDQVGLDIADLKKSRDMAAGKASQTSVMVSYVIGIAGLVMGVIGLFVK
jgi:hypothetical protein